MATAADIEAALTLEMNGIGVTPERFQRGLTAFFGLINEVARAVSGDGQRVQWRVQVKSASNLVGVMPALGFRPEIAGQIATIIREGFDSLDKTAEAPKNFTDAAMKYARDLGEITRGNDAEVLSLRLWANKRPVRIGGNIAKHVSGVLSEEYDDYGSVDGYLQTVSDRGGMRFILYDRLTDKGINCFISEEKLEGALSSFRKRVEIYGLIKYRRDGTPVSIRVDEIEPFPNPASLPTFESVRGIYGRKQ